MTKRKNILLTALLVIALAAVMGYDTTVGVAQEKNDAPDELTFIDMENPSKGGFASAPRISADGKFVAGSKFVVTSGEYEVINVWDAETGKHLRSIELKTEGRIPGGGKAHRVFNSATPDLSPDGSLIAVAYGIGVNRLLVDDLDCYLAHYVVLIDARTGQEVRLLATHLLKTRKVGLMGRREDGTDAINFIRFSPDGKKIALVVSTMADDKQTGQTLQFLDAQTGNVLQTIDEKGRFASAAFSREGKKLLVTFDGIRRINEKRPLGDMLVVEHARVQIYDVDTGKRLQEWRENEEGKYFTANISADGTKVVTHTDKGTNIKIWDTNTGKELRTIENEKLKTSQSISFIPGTKNIVVSFFRDPALIIDVETGDPISLLPPPLPDDIGVAHVSADGRKIVTSIMSSYHVTGARVWTLPKGIAPKERYEPPTFPTYTGTISRTDTTMTGHPTDLPKVDPPKVDLPKVCTCNVCCECKHTCDGIWQGRKCDKKPRSVSPDGCTCHEVGTAIMSLEGIWRQYVGSSTIGDYEVKLDKATKKYEMARVDGRITGKGITNVQFDGKTWSFDSDWGSRVVPFVLTKVDNDTFEGIVDGSQKNKWVRIKKAEVVPKIVLDKPVYAPGEKITVIATGITPEMIRASAFVAIYVKDAPHRQYGQYKYPRTTEAILEFTAPRSEGNYEMRLYNRDGLYTDETFVLKVPFNVGTVPTVGGGVSQSSVSDTKLYKNAKYGYSFRYPADWTQRAIEGLEIYFAGQPDAGFTPSVGIGVEAPNEDLLTLTKQDYQEALGAAYRKLTIKEFRIRKISGMDCLFISTVCIPSVFL